MRMPAFLILLFYLITLNRWQTSDDRNNQAEDADYD